MARLSERALISMIRQQWSGTATDVEQGIGDDCAVFKSIGSKRWLASTDSLVDGVHFDRRWHPAEMLGRKCVAVNLSDIAAMGGIPRFFLISLCLPPFVEQNWLQDWLSGVHGMLDEYGCTLIGGDTVRGKELVISVTVLGEADSNQILYRHGARPGDSLYVSGPLGSAAAGLSLFQWMAQEKMSVTCQTSDTRWQQLLQAHLNPVPRVLMGQILSRSGMVTAMQDISDGLATDLAHICEESGVGATVVAGLLPSIESLEAAASILGRDILDWQLKGGEDYELLFSVRSGQEQTVETLASAEGFILHRVGEIRKEPGVFLQTGAGGIKEITFQGYEHT